MPRPFGRVQSPGIEAVQTGSSDIAVVLTDFVAAVKISDPPCSLVIMGYSVTLLVTGNPIGIFNATEVCSFRFVRFN